MENVAEHSNDLLYCDRNSAIALSITEDDIAPTDRRTEARRQASVVSAIGAQFINNFSALSSRKGLVLGVASPWGGDTKALVYPWSRLQDLQKKESMR